MKSWKRVKKEEVFNDVGPLDSNKQAMSTWKESLSKMEMIIIKGSSKTTTKHVNCFEAFLLERNLPITSGG